MPFIGQEPLTGAYHVLDAITASATAIYNLQLNSGAFSPATANQLLVSLNGVIQKPGSSFTISGSQITFSSALSSSDSIDFIIALGDVLSVGTPTDGSVATAKIAPSAVTTAKIDADAVTTAKIGASQVTDAKLATAHSYVHIKTVTGTNVSSLDFLHGSSGVIFDNTYDMYEFIIHYAYNASAGRDFRIVPSQNGSSFSASNTECIRFRTIFENGSAGSGHSNATNLGVWRSYLNIGSDADDPITARIQVAHPYDSDKRTIFMTDAGGRDPANYYREMASGNPTSAGRTYGARFQAENGNTNAKVSLYGIKYA